jgi:hypothetical protein
MAGTCLDSSAWNSEATVLSKALYHCCFSHNLGLRSIAVHLATCLEFYSLTSSTQLIALQPRCFILAYYCSCFSFAATAFLKSHAAESVLASLPRVLQPCCCNFTKSFAADLLWLTYHRFYSFAAVTLWGACSYNGLVSLPWCWQLIESQAKKLLFLVHLLCDLQPFCFHLTQSHAAVLLLPFYCMCYSLATSPLQSLMQPCRFIAVFHRCYSLASYT